MKTYFDRFPSLPSSSNVLCFFLLRMKKNTTNAAARELTITTVTGMTISALGRVLFFLAGLSGGLLLTVGMKSERFEMTSGIQR